MEAPTVAPRTPNTKGKEVVADLAKKKAAFDRIFKAYKDRNTIDEARFASLKLDLDVASLQRLPSKPNFRARFLGFDFEGHCVIRLEDKEFPFFQIALNDFYASEEIKVQNQVDPLELHIGGVVCSEMFGNFYRAEVKYIDPLLKFCSVLDIDAGEYHAVNFGNLYELEERFFNTSAQVIECTLDGLQNIQKSCHLVVANKLKLPDNKVRVTSVGKNRKGEPPVVSIVTSKGDSLIDLLDDLLELDEDNEALDMALLPESLPKSVIKEAETSQILKPFGQHNDCELEMAKRDVKVFMENYCKSEGIPLSQLYGYICQYTGRPILWKKMGFPHWYIFLVRCEKYFYLKGSSPDRRGNFLVFPADHIDKPNSPAGYTRVDVSILFKLVPSELEIAVKRLNGESSPQTGHLPLMDKEMTTGESKPMQKPIRPLVIPTLDDSGTDADCSDYGSSPEYQKQARNPKNGIINEKPGLSVFVTSQGKQEVVVLKEEPTDYLFYSNRPEEHVPLPTIHNLDLSRFERSVKERTSKTLEVVRATEAPAAAQISTTIENPVPIPEVAFQRKFKAKLLGVDMYGFFFIQLEDPLVNSKYEEQQRQLNEFYTEMTRSQYRLTGKEIMEEGKVVGFVLENNFVRARIFESNPLQCTLVDLEGHDFHFVNPVHMYRLDPQFLELPPQAMAVYLSGLESHLYTDAIPRAFQVTLLYPPIVTVEVASDIDDAYLASSVKMTWGCKDEDVSELLLEFGREFLSPLEEEDWEDRIEAMVLVRESLLKKKYLARL